MNGDSFTLMIPPTFYQERQYLAHVIFSTFLGLPVSLTVNDQLVSSYVLSGDEKEIVFHDCFFSKATDENEYLKKTDVPSDVTFVKTEYNDGDLVVFYGNGKVINEGSRIICGIDVFASVFFMLTRWEEYVKPDADFLNRFPAQASLAFRFNFLHRAVINEWISFLRSIILAMFPSATFKPEQKFEIVFTHDIDFLNAPVSLREFAKDILKKKSFYAFGHRVKYATGKQNPYDLFDFFMDVSERNNTLSHFYFMTGHNVTGKDGENYNRTPTYCAVLDRIKERGHKIGFHPSLLSYDNPSMFAVEKKKLENDIHGAVTEGRQHALRFKMPLTWRIWNENGMKVDSTLGYSAQEGFRCGTGWMFPVYDIEKRVQLDLHERPLVLMDTTLHINRRLDIEQSYQVISGFTETARKHNMPLTVLFHNLIADNIDWKGWKELYQQAFMR
jgi:hypothetical protein